MCDQKSYNLCTLSISTMKHGALKEISRNVRNAIKIFSLRTDLLEQLIMCATRLLQACLAACKTAMILPLSHNLLYNNYVW